MNDFFEDRAGDDDDLAVEDLVEIFTDVFAGDEESNLAGALDELADLLL